ncbi:MAG TPA: dihydrofolate reductase family protein [Aggregatilinea sp.]|uniref:dihydrofolate reductase family protein n=1 Tax=Aggregatilinea sp. TaxID=2806333 RepID=UPI002B6CCBDF|nr:dihydrofolate reductase family protein [Aggregatilinea sp.]HML21947.1 dihydrofolate reductase family protein [Aggregatilinea sp.]
MHKIIVSQFITLDGVLDEPDKWSLDYWNDEIAQFKGDEMINAGGLLLGRVTYDGFAAAWPDRPAEEGGEQMNGMPKYVATTTLDRADWQNTTLLKGDIIGQIKQLKAADGGDLLVYGSGTLIQTLIAHDLIDEYRLLVYPVVRGTGSHLFEDGAQTKLDLVEAKPVGSGVVALTYRARHDA